jgi:acetate kinase
MPILVFVAEDEGVRFLLKDQDNSLPLFGSVTGIETESAQLRFHKPGEKETILLSEVNDVSEAVLWVRDFLLEKGFVSALAEISLIAQMVAHGGDKYKIPTVIVDEVIADLDKLKDFAPVPLEFNLACIRAVKKHFPGIRQVAVFDTAFHQTIPEYATLYAIPYDYIQKYGIRSYGFHGISHKYMTNLAFQHSGIDKNKSRIITMHLGQSCSITAVKNGVAIDTSMGFSPMEGLVMKYRAGNINFDVLSFLHNKENMSFEELDTMLYKFSGLYGLSGGLNSMEEIISEKERGNKIAENAYQAFVYSIRKYLGAYYLLLGGLDVIVFTGAMVRSFPQVRKSIFEGLNHFGIKVDDDRNERCVDNQDGEISADTSPVKIYYIRQSIRLAIYEEVQKIV